ncbi:MAG TPA: superoxide dismutase family protein [Kofleriaceae bacterium]|nr:superoxide dismutase family protein [Kofleriaceae bacterium]
MKTIALLATCLAVAACGGKSKPSTTPPPAEVGGLDEAVEPIAEPEPEPEPPPPARWSARAELVPVKGATMKPRVVAFAQTEGSGTEVEADAAFAGLKPGTYHLVVHTSGECGKNATKAGPAWAVVGTILELTATKQAPASLAESDVDLMLDGDSSIIGRTLVLHDDKKGKPNKAIACGTITADGGDSDDEE